MPKELDDMVDAIKASHSNVNPWAVARAKLGSDKQIMARRGTGSKSKVGDRKLRRKK